MRTAYCGELEALLTQTVLLARAVASRPSSVQVLNGGGVLETSGVTKSDWRSEGLEAG